MPCSLTKSSDCVCPRSNTAKQKRKHRIGIIRPLLCFLSVIGFRVLAFAGHRNDGPDRPLACVQLPLFLFRELFIWNKLFQCWSLLLLYKQGYYNRSRSRIVCPSLSFSVIRWAPVGPNPTGALLSFILHISPQYLY